MSPPWIVTTPFVGEEVKAGFWDASDSASMLNPNGLLFCPVYIMVSRASWDTHIESLTCLSCS